MPFADITKRRLRHPRQTWKAKVFATSERDSSLRSVESAVLGGVSMCP